MPKYNTPKRFPGSQHLPELAQQLLQRFFPPDELPTPATTIGPKAILLDDELGYMKKVLGETFADMGEAGHKYFRSGASFGQTTPAVKNIMGKIAGNTNLMAKTMAAQEDPGLVRKFTNTTADRNPDWAKGWIQDLADLFTPEY